ncbi:MAG: type II toxin-antitoxin system RelE/ParE family toxin [Chlorobi bacterium]|nr:type II toxin-antitoxin system RelE/ParE family toxin [Chlorobiota bacterium]
MEFWYRKNGNSSYARKLDAEIRQIVSHLRNFDKLGKKFKNENLRYIFKGDFSIYYEISDEYVEILHIWDNRQNPDSLPLLTNE